MTSTCLCDFYQFGERLNVHPVGMGNLWWPTSVTAIHYRNNITKAFTAKILRHIEKYDENNTTKYFTSKVSVGKLQQYVFITRLRITLRNILLDFRIYGMNSVTVLRRSVDVQIPLNCISTL